MSFLRHRFPSRDPVLQPNFTVLRRPALPGLLLRMDGPSSSPGRGIYVGSESTGRLRCGDEAPSSSHAVLISNGNRNEFQPDEEVAREFDNSTMNPAGSIHGWESKLNALLSDGDCQELVSREKKDRVDFQQIADLATSRGLYSQLYAKAVVVSKVPLPDYRFDLDDKRPKREVILSPGVYSNVKAHIENFTSAKCESTDELPQSSGNGNISAEERLFDEPATVPLSEARNNILGTKCVQLLNDLRTWQASPEGRKMMEFRSSLPTYKEKNALLRAISENQVVIVSGETGCGKTTQIPQYILESEIEYLRGAMCNIICTQPRKISAISVSERIAAERGEKLGETVGYKIRLEGVKGRDTRLLFCTTGILLRRLTVDKNLKGVTHIIVDEIHERGLNEDFLLIVLKSLLPHRPDLKIILMSATLDAQLFSSYFIGSQLVQIPGFTHPVQTYFLESILEITGYQLTDSNQVDEYCTEKSWKIYKQTSKKRKSQLVSAVEDTLFGADFSQYNARTKDSLSCWNPDSLGFNLIEHLLLRICGCGRPGAVLVFLTGWDDIISLKDKLQAHPVLGDGTRTLLLPCHGSMSSEEQKLIFCHPPYGVRKIVLATNIAETSITIDDVVFVIDCGKAKETSYDALNNTPRLLPSWISKVSAKQRRGRAGRVQPGECYHLYPRCVYDAFADYQLPEILRTPLQSLCLQIKSLKIRDISDFLSQALISPEKLAVQNAIEYLKIIGALDESEDLTVLGRYLTMLPMEPKLGKMVILGAIFKCLDPILTVVAGLSVRDPFVTPFDKKEQAEAAKAQFSQGYSDHLALVRAYEGWKAAGNGFYGFNYCWINFLSFQSMKAIDSLRVEFYSLLKDTGLVDSDPTAYNILSNDEHLIRAVICYGLYPGICSIVYNQKTLLLKTMEDGNVRLNYSSVNARQSLIPYPWLVFSEKFKVNSVFLRDSTAVSDSMLILFGGSITRGDLGRGHLKMLGGYLEFFMDGAVAELYIRLRDELDKFIHTKLVNPKIDVNSSYQELLSALRLVVSDDPSSGRFVLVSGCSSSSAAAPAAAAVQEQKTIAAAPNCSAGENTKGELQTLMTRAGYGFPSYKTVQLNDLRFQSTVDVNGTTITGKACSNKKLAEKDAAGQALAWLLGEDGAKHGVGRISALLTKRKKDHHHHHHHHHV